ncbi:hypothetical protein BDZ97DRAFT_1153012 [Flammula alnicola]|nr:hypothetical protein BDZ97DRAFT_1153012 [Flammula alnicola]
MTSSGLFRIRTTYVHFAGDRTYQTPVWLPVVDPHEFACLPCAASKCRLYTAKVLKQHLKDKHSLVNAIENQDWKKITATLRTTLTSAPRARATVESS